jgi:hypothetical protein
MIPDSVSSSARDKAPDFRTRAMAKQAWLVRRSEPKRGLLLGLIAGGAIGCLGAFAVMSVVPNEGPARATTGAAPVTANQPTGGQTASNEAAGKGTNDISKPNIEVARTTAAPTAAAAPGASPVTPRPDAARNELSSNAKVTAVTPATPPATQSLTSDAPVLAQGGTPEPKPRVAEKKKKKKQVVRHQRNRPQPNQWARPDNFFFGGDRMARSF